MQLRQSFIIAAILGVTAITSWEIYWRCQGVEPYLDDNKDLWANQRQRLQKKPKNTIVFIGSSRILYDIQLDLWRDLTHTEPIMLAVQGSSPIPIFEDIVKNTDFAGTLVVGVTPALLFSTTFPKAPPMRRAIAKVDYFKNRTYAQRINHILSVPLQTNLAFIRDGDEAWDSDVDLGTLLSRIHISERAGPPPVPFNNFEEIGLDRHMKMPEYVTNDTSYANTIKAVWKDILSADRPPPDKTATMAAFEKLANTFTKRGGNLILVRCPSSGLFKEVEAKGFPRHEFWDVLVNKVNAQSYHYEDYPQFQNLFLPEWSHLSAEDARFFTRELIGILKAEKAIPQINIDK
ncbi:hypothetical protein J4050_05025 [Winogradskyella sp. DF17]|uniref:SGNH/GDSL hydrolase family protein n=1 Tax=Winogradskyella pelagia TaxID=2819984 RepID=A0ABS3T028_9FLAO|nr:hypothetical protein [Winogradskyella sp. DF17]MBO3116097.1 hypothetical protein [Winogradskyella sp. DF17]